MDEKEKYRAEIDAKLVKFGETLNEIKTKKELRNETSPDFQIDATLRKHEAAAAKIKELDGSDEGAWNKLKSEVDGLMGDIDKELRQALAYFG